MTTIVEVKLELGHRAKVRDAISPEGHTHDWVVFVKGSERIELEYFVEKVVFWLHESYEQNRRVLRHTPYKVEQSGFAGFNMLIDVHFRNQEEPKMVRFQYDLFLHTEEMPPVNHTRLEKLTFTNPTEEFRKKLINAGAHLVNTTSLCRPSKDRPSQNSISALKKDRSKLREDSNRRESSKGKEESSNRRRQDERKNSSFVHNSKKDGRIPGKDMKKHEAFKHLKSSSNFLVENQKHCAGEKDKAEWDGANKRKRARDEGHKKKKKKWSNDCSSPSDQLKSLGTSSQKSLKKDRVKRIQPKPDSMAGLFAPENSINMAQIKQSKEKAKQEKRSATDTAHSRRSALHSKQEGLNVVPLTRISPAGSITLKICKERVAGAEKDKTESRLETPKVKNEPCEKVTKQSKISSEKGKNDKKGKTDSARKNSPISSDSSSGRITIAMKEKGEVKPLTLTRVAKKESYSKEKGRSEKRKMGEKDVRMKSLSPSVCSDSNSVSGSNMDISSDDCSLPDRSMPHSSYSSPKSKLEYEKVEIKPTFFAPGREGPKTVEKRAIDTSCKVKVEKVQSEGDKAFNISKLSEKYRYGNLEVQKHSGKKYLGKPKKSVKDDKLRASSRPQFHKSTKQKRSPKEKSNRHSSKERKFPASNKKEKQSLTPNSTSTTGCASIKKGSKTETSLCRSSVSPRDDVEAEKSANMPTKEKPKSIKKHTVDTKPKGLPSCKQIAKAVLQNESKTKTVLEFIETDNSSDNDIDLPDIKESRANLSEKEHCQKASTLLQSPPSPLRSHPMENEYPFSYHNVQQRLSQVCSSPESSGDEEIAMSEIPPCTSAMNIISPIRDNLQSFPENLCSTASAYDEIELSDSSISSHLKRRLPMQSNLHDEPGSRTRELGSPEFFENMDISGEPFCSSSDEKNSECLENPLQNNNEHLKISNQHVEESSKPCDPEIVILTGQGRSYPHMTESLYRELQDLQTKISCTTDIGRLQKIACIIAKSQQLQKNEDYFDTDLCSLDNKTIHKIRKQLEAVQSSP